MTRKTRTILFLISLIIFLTAAPLAVFYSLGYRFDFQKRKIVQVGAFYLKVLPKNAEVAITPLGGKQSKGKTKKTDFFFGAAFLENFLPQKYKIEVRKENFHPWEKTLEAEEKKVTEAKNIILVPKKFNFASLSKNIEDFFVFPDQKKLLLKENDEDNWSLKLFEAENNVKSHLISARDLAKTKIDLLDLRFSRDSKRILLKTKDLGNEKYFLLDLNEDLPSLLTLDFLKGAFTDIQFNPENSQKLLLLKGGRLFEADLNKKTILPPALKDAVSFEVFNKDIYFIDSLGFLFKTDLSFGRTEKLSEASLPPEKAVQWQIHVFPEKIFVQDDNNLFLFNPDSKSFERFFEAKKEPKISPDKKKIAYFSEHEIWVMYLEPELGQPQKKAGEKSFLARFSEKISDVFWYGDYHLILNQGNKIKIAEIDDRDRINIIDLTTFEIPAQESSFIFKIFFNSNGKKIYTLIGQNLSSSETSLP